MLITTDKQFRRAIGWLTLAFSAAMIVLGETVLALTSPPEPREIKLAWNPPTNAVEFAELRYQVYLGTNSGSYFTNWTVMSTNAVVVRETGGGWTGAKWAIFQFLWMFALAYGAAFLVYRTGLALGFPG